MLEPVLISEPAPPIVTKNPLLALWDMSPVVHWWDEEFQVGNPSLVRVETVPHGPMVAAQAGKTRPYLGSKKESSVWTETLRRLAIIAGPLNRLYKGSENGYLEKRISSAITAGADGGGTAPFEGCTTYAGGGASGTDPALVLDGGNAAAPGGTSLDGNNTTGNFCG